MKKIAAIYTGAALVDPLRKMLKERMPEYGIINILDDSLIADVIAAGGVTPQISARLLSYYRAAVDSGACAILNTCSSIGDVVELAKPFVTVPILRIDDAMARKAVAEGKTIAVIATLPTTLKPTADLLELRAKEAGKSVKIIRALAEGAFAAITEGDAATHDRLILEKALAVAKEADLIVLAQGSMARMEETLARETGKIVLSSPRLGVDAFKELVKGLK
ncbi:MAG: aspartate/glutamate racemase family protein [Treponemataceae bacterium]